MWEILNENLYTSIYNSYSFLIIFRESFHLKWNLLIKENNKKVIFNLFISKVLAFPSKQPSLIFAN